MSTRRTLLFPFWVDEFDSSVSSFASSLSSLLFGETAEAERNFKS